MAVHFFPKKLTTFLVVTFKRTLNVQTSKQRGKNLAADRRGPLATGAPSHGTTDTMDNPALDNGRLANRRCESRRKPCSNCLLSSAVAQPCSSTDGSSQWSASRTSFQDPCVDSSCSSSTSPFPRGSRRSWMETGRTG